MLFFDNLSASILYNFLHTFPYLYFGEVLSIFQKTRWKKLRAADQNIFINKFITYSFILPLIMFKIKFALFKTFNKIVS